MEWGPVREVWFATLADPSTKHSFLIRDDAYGKQGAQFSKTLRFGDPVTLGPNSTWRQTTWEGGNQQETWVDRAMYHKATVDSSSERGKLKLWPGYLGLVTNGARAHSRYIMTPGPYGWGADTPLYVAENNDFGYTDPTTGTTVPPGGFALGRYDPSTGTFTTLKSDFSAGIRFMTRVNDQGDPAYWLFVGTADGKFYVHETGTLAWGLEAEDATYPAQANCAVPFKEAVYFAQRNKISKRTFAPGASAPEYQLVAHIYNSQTINGMVSWNNRIWISASIAGGINQVLVSDGVSVVPAFIFPNEFTCQHMAVHYGSLYFAGYTQGSLGTSGYRGQIWRYNGASLTKVYEAGSAADGENHMPFQTASHRQYLAWGRAGVPSTGRKPGLMLYDAELDAIVDGPTLDMDSETSLVQCTGVTVWADTLVASFRDDYNYSGSVNKPGLIAAVKKTGAVRHTIPAAYGGNSFSAQQSSRTEYLLSSVFDGEVPGEQKVWLTGRIRVKIPAANASVTVVALLDEGTTEYSLTTVGYDASNTNFRTVVFPIKNAGQYLRSGSIQYKVYIFNSDSGNNDSTANPVVDLVEFDYMVSPAKRRQWQVRALCFNGQRRLDGTSNPLSTVATQVAKLEELWGSAVPVLFWDANADGGTPSGSATAEVMIQSFNDQEFRVDSRASDKLAEVSLTLVEIVQA